MIEILNGAGSLEFFVIFIVGAILISFLLTRGRSTQVSALKRENHRLRNILADLMLDNANLKDVQ